MAKKKTGSVERELRKQVKTKFHAAVQDKCGGNQALAGRALGLERQRFHQYLHGDLTPPAAILALACEKWKIEFDIGTIKLRATHFKGRRAQSEEPTSEQLHLFDRPGKAKGERIVVKVSRKQLSRIAIDLEIDLSPK